MILDKCRDCGHAAHESNGCYDITCGCETMWTAAQAREQLDDDSFQDWLADDDDDET